MSNRRTWLAGLAVVALVAALMWGQGLPLLNVASPALAQAQVPASTATPASAPTAAPAPAPAAPAAPATPLPLSGTFTDPQNRYQVGILETMTVSSAGGGNPLFQQPDGNLAYSVVVVPLAPDTADPLPDIALVQAAQRAFGAGEGFQTRGFQPVAGGGLQIGWAGRLSQGATPPQPISGSILAKQQGAQIFLLMVAATEDGSAQVADAIASLLPTLKVL